MFIGRDSSILGRSVDTITINCPDFRTLFFLFPGSDDELGQVWFWKFLLIIGVNEWNGTIGEF